LPIYLFALSFKEIRSLQEEIRMKPVLLLISMLLPFSVALAANGRVPELNVQAICKTRDADARLFRSTTGQSVDECVHDEENARQQLNSLWASTAAPIRNRCESEGRSLGITSYLDLVACIQMAAELKDDIKPEAKKTAPKE
jgi:hypothetical protein